VSAKLLSGNIEINQKVFTVYC